LLKCWECGERFTFTELETDKKYRENDLFDLLHVTYEKLTVFYEYLQENLKFPFAASYQQEVGPLAFSEHNVNCIRLYQEVKVDEFYGWWNADKGGKK
jgi:hypothetical protein